MLSIGLMSGTSMDGIDAALLEIDSPTNTIKDLCHLFLPYEPSFQTLLKAAEHAERREEFPTNKRPNY